MTFILDLEYQYEKTFEENKNIASLVDGEDVLRIFTFDKECISVGKLLYKKYKNKNNNFLPLVVRNSGGGVVFHSKEDICIASFYKLKDAKMVIKEVATKVAQAVERAAGKKPKIAYNGDVILEKKIFGVALGRLKNIWIAEGIIKISPQNPKIISEDNCFKENGFLNIQNNIIINSIIYTFQNG